MIKGLLITHGQLGKELIATAETILETKVDLECISLDWTEDGSRMIHTIESYLRKNAEHAIIIFTDMFGGSPANICFRFNQKNIEIITGINLAGLLKFLTSRNKKVDLKEFARSIKKGATDDINIISEYLGEKSK